MINKNKYSYLKRNKQMLNNFFNNISSKKKKIVIKYSSNLKNL